jgi:hypothetical protein
MNLHRLIKVFIAALLLTLPILGCGEDNVRFTVKRTTKHSISGSVVSGAPLSGATINLSGDADRTTTTDNTGTYVFNDLADGSYVITPALAGYISSPTSTVVTVKGSDVSNASFTATASGPTYRISGAISGAVLQGLTITLAGDANGTTMTDASGNYAFTGLVTGSYTVTPARAGYSFVSAKTAVTLSNANVTSINFAAMTNAGPLYSISGRLTGVVQQGVKINLLGTTCATTTTDAGGNYTFTGLPAGSYTIIPVTWIACSYIAAPTTMSLTVSNANVTNIDFTLSSGSSCSGVGVVVTPKDISGTVSGAVQQGVTMIITGSICKSTTTDASGNFTFSDYFTSGSYTVTPALVGHTFSPINKSVTVPSLGMSGVNFTAY